MARGGTVHVGAWLSDHRSIWLAFSAGHYGSTASPMPLRKPLTP